MPPASATRHARGAARRCIARRRWPPGAGRRSLTAILAHHCFGFGAVYASRSIYAIDRDVVMSMSGADCRVTIWLAAARLRRSASCRLPRAAASYSAIVSRAGLWRFRLMLVRRSTSSQDLASALSRRHAKQLCLPVVLIRPLIAALAVGVATAAAEVASLARRHRAHRCCCCLLRCRRQACRCRDAAYRCSSHISPSGDLYLH